MATSNDLHQILADVDGKFTYIYINTYEITHNNVKFEYKKKFIQFIIR